DVDADLADHALRQPAGQLRPAVTAVRGLPQPALLGAAKDRPRLALAAPGGSVDLARIRRIDRQVDEAGRIGDEQDLLPRRAAVARAVHAAIGVRPTRAAERGDVDEVGILRMRLDGAKLPAGAQSEERPRL